MVLALLGVATPNFWLGLMLIIAFSLNLRWFPSGGAEGWKSLVLPVITLGTGCMANITRTTRSSMLEVIRQDYIRTAKAKGVSHSKVINKHALKNALIPVVTVIGLHVISGIIIGFVGGKFNLYAGTTTPVVVYFGISLVLFLGVYSVYFVVTYVGFLRNVESDK